MVSNRQKVARKRYKEEHPELFPKPEPTTPKDPDKRKRKKGFKRKKSEAKEPRDPNKPIKRSFKKHPLRVPGMKPGESCFICKAKNHIAKNCPEKAQWEKNKICLLCRHRGHSLKNCPSKNEGSESKKLCYNCGETGHSLAQCPQTLEDGGTKFASCFICKEQGHLSKNCPQNTHGIYPKGGCCKICGGVTHLAKDCPNKGNRGSAPTRIEAFEDRPRPQVTKFVSGDDLDGDFVIEETSSGNKGKSASKVGSASDSKEGNVKSKKKEGTKVVNFVG
ncbi:uncharacterized protein C683.02c-like [Mangifera indica]|uniref:uncharacterized protein C683.02c-like n=1 Tax=Mangifera indica TaxID=29780 RepID=UPI001CFB9F45|nr:uncharacterized protein C683.02c-like [Mangifera indica]